MNDDYLIIKTMARCSMSYDIAKSIVKHFEKKGKLEEYEKIIQKVQTYDELKKYL